ncbi:MAG: YsnF/AvaK domain-containing protein [Anaerolineae bacterium]
MAKTVIGAYDDRTEAERVVQALADEGFSRNDISLMVRHEGAEAGDGERGRGNKAGEGAGIGAGIGAVLGGAGGLLVGLGLLTIPGIGPVLAAGPLAAALAGAGIGAGAGALVGALVGLGIPEEEAEYYAEAIRRGSTLVAVKAQDNMANRALSIMSRFNAVDIEDRAESWRAEGWMPASTDVRETARQDTGQRATMRRDEGADFEEVQEELRVGKREVDRGGVRVRSHTIEEPVEEDVTLREEHVDVQRKPVDRHASENDLGAFQEGSVEFRETAEEPAVEKQARVTEEVHVGKRAQERKETIRDTLRRVEVEVDDISGRSDAGDYSKFDNAYRRHFLDTYGTSSHDYGYYEPAYQYGSDLARSNRYSNRDWSDIEMDIRGSWEQQNPGTWDDVKDAIRQGFYAIRGERETTRSGR